MRTTGVRVFKSLETTLVGSEKTEAVDAPCGVRHSAEGRPPEQEDRPARSLGPADTEPWRGSPDR
jgi:hypothetical protein